MSPEPRPCLRLFFSADIAGSTAYKGRIPDSDRSDGRPHWLALYESFFAEFSVGFANEWAELNGQGDPASVWKLAGDEILLSQDICSITDVWTAVRSFKKALNGYQDYIRRKYDRNLGLKGSVWCAGFPVINSEIEVPGSIKGSKTVIVRDFIGPTIDAGFRLARHATPARTVLSPELAWLLSSLAVEAGETTIGIFYDGDVELKGVFGGRPVPLFSIDAGDLLEEARNTLAGRVVAPSRSIIAFVESFVRTIGNPTLASLPYLVNADGSAWGTQPERHMEELVKMRTRWEQETSDKAQWDERASEDGEVNLEAPALRTEF